MNRACTLLLLALAPGCGTSGALGQSQTHDGRGKAAEPLSAPIAVGATLAPEITIETQGSAAPGLALESVRPEIVEARSGSLVGRAPGVAAVLIREPKGTVLDLLHVWVAAPTHLSVHRLSNDGDNLGQIDDAFDLVVGDTIVLAPRAYAGPQRLAGSGNAKWTVEPGSVATVLRDGVPERRRLLARAPGNATLTIETLGKTTRVRFSVIAPAAGDSQ